MTELGSAQTGYPGIDQACAAVAELSPRVAVVLKADIRPGWTGQMTAKVERVEARLRQAD